MTATTDRPTPTEMRDQLALVRTMLDDSGCTLTIAEIERWVRDAYADEGDR